MGTVFWNQGISFRINLRERNETPHLHCVMGDSEARYDLRALTWMDCKGFTRSDLRKMEERIKLRLEECRAEWERLYGETNW